MDDKEKKLILTWIAESLDGENFSKFEIDLTGTTGKAEGYLGNTVFAKVSGFDDNNKYKEVHLFVKIGKNNENLRKNLPILEQCYKREIIFYKNVLPTLNRFISEKNISDSSLSFPKCYKTFITDGMEVIVLENLKEKGYTLARRGKPLDCTHLQLVLSAYAKFHASSFALREQKQEEFLNITEGYSPILKDLALQMKFFKNTFNTLKKTLSDENRTDLIEKYEKLMNKNVENTVLQIFDDVPREFVITHGDSHSNNFLFEYQGNNIPLNLAIIDMQISSLHSPVLDLSSFIYFSALDELSDLGGLLKFYHNELTGFLRRLGVDANDVFPFNVFLEHWKKYSNYGFAFATSFLKMLYIDSKDAPLLEEFDFNSDSISGEIFRRIKIKDENMYLNRLITIMESHFSFLNDIE